jgi:hypothetical protein
MQIFEIFDILSDISAELDVWNSNHMLVMQMMLIWKTPELNKVTLFGIQVFLYNDINKVDLVFQFYIWRTTRDFF